MEVVKKIFEAILILVLVLVILAVLALLGIFGYHRIMESKHIEFMEKKGYCDLVSVGDHSLNVVKTGNEDGRHRIVVLHGAGYGTMLEMKDFAKNLQEDDQVIFLSRPGYNGSDDIRDEITAELVVEDCRKALENAGVEKPYVLMPHSLGAIYASYWVSKYPDEIEAMVNLDGVCPKPVESPKEQDVSDMMYLYKLERRGFCELPIFRIEHPQFTETEEKAFNYMIWLTVGSDAFISDSKNSEINGSFVWNELVPNDVPKLYLSFTSSFRSADEVREFLENSELKQRYLDEYSAGFTGSDDELIDYVCGKMFDEAKREREEVVEPYAEKIGNCKIKDMPGDHFLYKSKPDECAEAVLDFLK